MGISNRRAPSWRARLGTTAVGAAVVMAGLLAPGAAAHAAPTFETEGTVTHVAFTSDGVTSSRAAEISADWSLPDHPASPAGFTLPLPADLQGRTDAFPLTGADGAPIGQCRVSATQVVCDLDPAFLSANPLNISGTVNFWVRVATEVSETTRTTYDFGTVQAAVDVHPSGRETCTADCLFSGRGDGKWGWAYMEDDGSLFIDWAIGLAADRAGDPGGREVTVTDHLVPGLTVTDAWVVATDELAVGDDGYERPTGWRPLAEGQYAVERVGEDVAVSFTTQRGFFYDVHVVTRVEDGGAARTYRNTADIAVRGQETVPVEATVTRQGGGATGTGTSVGRFSITKAVEGTGVGAVAGRVYTGSYLVTVPGGEAVPGAFRVTAGETWTSPDYPRGTVVTALAEDAPADSDGLAWDAPVFSVTGPFTIDGGATSPVTLTNRVTLHEDVPSGPGEPSGEPSVEPSGEPRAAASPSAPPASLARTGGDVPVGVIGAGALLLLAGIGVRAAVRRR